MGLNLLGFLVGGLGAMVIIKFGDRLGINDIPNHRSSHTKIIPRGGGIGILATFILAGLILSISFGLLIPSLMIAIVSMWGGDKQQLAVKERLFFQFGCSMIFLMVFLYSKQVSFSDYLLLVPLSVFIVGTSNFYNFMDGIDGIAGITGSVGFLLLYLNSSLSGAESSYATLCLVMSFSCLGFLCFNFPKAKVFLGDIGSILIGFVFACMVIVLSDNMLDFVVMAGFIAPFYFDEFVTMFVRITEGDSLIVAHRKHLYQLLANEIGIRHWKVSLAYGVFQLLIGVTVMFLKPLGFYFVLLGYLAYSLISVWVSKIIRKKASVQ